MTETNIIAIRRLPKEIQAEILALSPEKFHELLEFAPTVPSPIVEALKHKLLPYCTTINIQSLSIHSSDIFEQKLLDLVRTLRLFLHYASHTAGFMLPGINSLMNSPILVLIAEVGCPASSPLFRVGHTLEKTRELVLDELREMRPSTEIALDFFENTIQTIQGSDSGICLPDGIQRDELRWFSQLFAEIREAITTSKESREEAFRKEEELRIHARQMDIDRTKREIQMQAIRSQRQSIGQCINCGGPLSFFDRLLKRSHHSKCLKFKFNKISSDAIEDNIDTRRAENGVAPDSTELSNQQTDSAITSAKDDDIRLECPQCRQHLSAPSDMGGEQVNCPVCNTSIKIPNHSSENPSTGGETVSDMLRIEVGYSRANHIVGRQEQITKKLSINLDDLLLFLKQDFDKHVVNIFEQQIILDTQHIRALVEFSSVNMDELKNYLVKRWSSISESPNNYVSIRKRNYDWGGIEAWTILFDAGNP